MSDKVSITYVHRPDASAQGELDALAAVYRFILFESSASKEGGPETAPNDAERRSDEFGATDKYSG